ncbi:TIGR03643 family protein [Marinagarivorans algicola]|uniref:TIGR03643 family protein n=2 Tax=Marinagarivorans algicola TaxID=1513270 RepID=UPI001FD3FF86|nr:TIGR03643 family protein [Marinagarivorans algicola]
MAADMKDSDISRIIEMAWEDRTPFEAIETVYNLNESEVIQFMRKHIKPQSFKVWRQRMAGRKTVHAALRSTAVKRGYCATQYKMKSSR